MTSPELDRLRRKHSAFVDEVLAQYTQASAVDEQDSPDEMALNALRGLDEDATLNSWLSARLSGNGIRDGSIDSEILDDFMGPLRSEVQAAVGNSGVEARLELVGLTRGSAVLHFEPIITAPQDDHLRSAAAIADDAISRVLNVHNLIEQEEEAVRISEQYGDLLDSLNRLTSALIGHNVELDLRWRSATGRELPISHLGRRGLAYAERLFECRDVDELVQVTGYVYGTSLTGEIVLKKNVAQSKSATHKIRTEGAQVRSLGFRLGDRVTVELRKQSQIDQAGRVYSPSYQLIRVLNYEPILDDLEAADVDPVDDDDDGLSSEP